MNPRCASGTNVNLAHLRISPEAAWAAAGDATRPQALAALATTLRPTTRPSSPNRNSNIGSVSGSASSARSNDGAAPAAEATGLSDGDPHPAREETEAPAVLFDCAVANLP